MATQDAPEGAIDEMLSLRYPDESRLSARIRNGGVRRARASLTVTMPAAMRAGVETVARDFMSASDVVRRCVSEVLPRLLAEHQARAESPGDGAPADRERDPVARRTAEFDAERDAERDAELPF